MSPEQAGAHAPSPQAVKAMFFVTAEPEPGLMPRLVEPFAKLGLVPERAHMSAEQRAGAEINADLRVSAIPRHTAALIDKALRRVVGVRQVITLVE